MVERSSADPKVPSLIQGLSLITESWIIMQHSLCISRTLGVGMNLGYFDHVRKTISDSQLH